MLCPKCGSENPNDSVFCVSCGEKMKEEANNKKLFMPLIIVSVLCVGLAVSTIVLAILYDNSLEAYQSLSQDYHTLADENENNARDKNYYKSYYDKKMREAEENRDGNALERLYEYADTHPLVE